MRFRPSEYLPPQVVNIDLTGRQRGILQILGRRGPISPGDLTEFLERLLGEEVNRRTLQNDLKLLQQLGLADFSGRGPGVRWRLVANPPSRPCLPAMMRVQFRAILVQLVQLLLSSLNHPTSPPNRPVSPPNGRRPGA